MNDPVFKAEDCAHGDSRITVLKYDGNFLVTVWRKGAFAMSTSVILSPEQIKQLRDALAE